MFVCDYCAVFHFNDDCSGTGWDVERANEIAENLSGLEVFIEDGLQFVMDHCLGCGQSGIDAYRAGYYDYHGELVTN